MSSGSPNEQAHNNKEGENDQDSAINAIWEKTKEGAEFVKEKIAEEAKDVADYVKSGWGKTKEGAENVKEKLTEE